MAQDSQRILDEARQQFEKAGLPFPPIPPQFADQIQRVDSWVYGTRPGQSELYYIDTFIDEALSGQVRDYIQFGHSGRGTNSWALHYYLVEGPLALFVQVGWGGALTEPEDNARAALKLKQLMTEAERLRQAVANGKLPAGQRLVVEVSTFYGSQWLKLEAGQTVSEQPTLPWHEARDDRILPEVISSLNT